MVYALTPQSLLWSATVAVEPGAAGFAALALATFFLFCRRPCFRLAVLAASALALACQFRPESVLILVVAAVFVFLVEPSLLRRRELWTAALVTLALLVPHLIHTWAVRHEGWGAGEGGKFSWSVVRGNAETNFGYYVGAEDFPWLFTAFALVGLFFPGNPGRRRQSFTLLVWFALLFGIFIPFYAGSYRYGADVRFSLVSAAPLAALAGAGLAAATARLRAIQPNARVLALAPYALVLYAFSAYLPLARSIGRESWASRADHEVALRVAGEVPEDSIVLTHNPGMLQVMGRSAAQTSLATYQPERVDDFFRRFSGGVYFHYSFWCNVPDPVQNEFCANVLKTYGTRVVFEESAGFYRYVLYRLLPK
jgi:4-amino-4-deoxy-L-arabinose transferase-like glycosyltransferase